jgi:hypothetical protein
MWTYLLTRTLLIAAAVVAGLIAVYGGAAANVPAAGETHPALLLQPSPYWAVIGVGLLMFLAAIAGTIIAGRVRPDAGIFAAGWVALTISWNSGTIRDALFITPAAGTYLTLAMETALLALLLAVPQFLLRSAVRTGAIRPDHSRDGIAPADAGLPNIAIAVAATAAIYVALSMLMVVTVDKRQAIFGTAAAAFTAAAAVHYFLAPRAPAWAFWSGVMLGAVAAYLWAFARPGTPDIGVVTIAPARALPLDHAAAAAVFAVYGYWSSRRWKRADAEQNPASSQDIISVAP